MKKLIGFAVLLIGMSLHAGNAFAGCNINFGVKNTNSHAILVHTETVTAVKTRNGSWRGADNGDWGPAGTTSSNATNVVALQPGKTYKDTYFASFGCNKKRRYRIHYICGGSYHSANSRVTTYFPSATGFTTKTQFVARLNGC